MLKDMDFGVYGKGIDGYVHYSLAMDRIREEEENRKALMDEFDNDEDNFDSDDLAVFFHFLKFLICRGHAPQ